MRKRSESTTRYCCQCRSTTKWVLEKRDGGDSYRCIGDDDRHPERNCHGCGTAIEAEKFLNLCSSVPVQKKK